MENDVNKYAVSIHAPLARSNWVEAIDRALKDVSIHAPLARSNSLDSSTTTTPCSFNTCSSCEEQHVLDSMSCRLKRFQYMLLLRGATLGALLQFFCCERFNTCSSCEEQRGTCNSDTPLFSSFNTCSSCEEQLRPVRNVDV